MNYEDEIIRIARQWTERYNENYGMRMQNSKTEEVHPIIWTHENKDRTIKNRFFDLFEDIKDAIKFFFVKRS